MRILHTSDWHLGKRLKNKQRLPEQAEVLGEIVTTVKAENVDVVLVAGDVFDTFVPAAEAEQLFYDAVIALSEHAVVALIAGNHDDASRLSAPAALARRRGILILGEDDEPFSAKGAFGGKETEIEGGKGLVRITRGGETLNLGYLPYPSGAMLAALGGESDYTAAVKATIDEIAKGFVPGEPNVMMTHVFVTGAQAALTDERELGGTKLLGAEALDIPGCSYVALGHIHKPMTVPKARNAFYSGSLLRYDFSDTSDKRVIIADVTGEGAKIRSVPVSSGKKLVTVTVRSADEAIKALDEHENDYVRIDYDSAVPLTSPSVAEMRKRDCFVEVRVAAALEAADETAFRRGKTDSELFEMFYEAKTARKPSPRTMEIFLKALGGERL